MFLLTLGACGSEVVEHEPADTRPLLVLYTAPGLELGRELREAIEAEGAFADLVRFEVRDPGDDEFQRAFGTGGRLGLVWIDAAGTLERGMLLSTLPGYAPVQDVLARTRAVQRGLAIVEALPATPENLARLQLGLRAFVPAEQRLKACLAGGPDPDLEELHARVLVRRGEIQAALQACAALETSEPSRASRPSVLLTRALARIASREPERALELLAQIPADSPQGDQVGLARGTALHHAQREGALEELVSVQERYPLSPWSPDVRDEIDHVLSPPLEHTH